MAEKAQTEASRPPGRAGTGVAAGGAGTIAGFYQRDPKRSVPALSGGWPAFAATDVRDGSRALMAVQIRPALPPRARILDFREQESPRHVLMPLADGPGPDAAPGPALAGAGQSGGLGGGQAGGQGSSGWFVVCAAPPGPALDLKAGAWREQELIASVLMPAAAALQALEERGLTHRAIRPDNLFRAGPGKPVTLGPFWAAPPGTGQPAAWDPPFLAWCRPPCQGDGTTADDVYALGVTLLALAAGRMPLAGADPEEILARKLSAGSFAALTAGIVGLPSGLADLLRGMLADDPDHRPSPALLLDPVGAAARRSANRPPRRATRQIEVGGQSAWTARELAHVISRQPQASLALLRNGTVDRWLRRLLGDETLAVKLEEIRSKFGPDAQSAQQGAVLVMRAVAALEPLAPVVWRGTALWPDALGTAFAAADAPMTGLLREIVEHDVLVQWVVGQPRRTDVAAIRQHSADWHGWLAMRGPSGGLRRLVYALNPMLACASPLLAGRPVLRLGDLLPALEAAASRADRRSPPLDPDLAAFIAAHGEPGIKAELASLQSLGGDAERPLMMRLFAHLQSRLAPGPLPGLAGWLHECGLTGLERWRSRTTRAALARRVTTLAAAGDITALANATEDSIAFAADMLAAVAASNRMAHLRHQLHDSEQSAPRRLHEARRLAFDIAAGTGLLAMLGATVRLAIG